MVYKPSKVVIVMNRPKVETEERVSPGFVIGTLRYANIGVRQMDGAGNRRTQ